MYNILQILYNLCYKGFVSGYGDTVSYFHRINKWWISVIIYLSGDDRLRRERLVSDCEPRGTDLDKSVQKNKCQSHKQLRCYASRCLVRD